MHATGHDFGQVAEVVNPHGAGPVVLICEHAAKHIPESLNGLGLAGEARESHIAWDPGARDLAVLLSQALDAPLVAGLLSRLVYDCNRPPEAPGAMPELSETVEVPGNRGLLPEQRVERITGIYAPFRHTVERVLSDRRQAGQATAILTIHSFTPVYFGQPREVEIGVLHDDDSVLADVMLGHADCVAPRIVRRNDPYGPDDGVTHSLRVYGIANALPNVMIEVRNDLLTTPESTANIAQEILALLTHALAAVGLAQAEGPRHA